MPRIAAGEPRAMNDCIARYGNLVWGVVRRFVKDTTAAEDLVQEVFTELWKKAATFDAEVAAEATFVGMVARRRAIDFLRRQGRQPEFESIAAAESLPAPTATLDSIGCDPEAVKSSVAALPEETRTLFQLFFDQGLTHPEIADRTGLPLGTIKTRLRRGLLSLRDRLRSGDLSNPQSAR